MHTHYAQAGGRDRAFVQQRPQPAEHPHPHPEGRRVREAFVAPAGRVIASADYSQIELRIMAHLSGDHSLLHAFHAGLDVHRATAAEVFGVEAIRSPASNAATPRSSTFGLIYGMSSFGLAKNPVSSQGRRRVHRQILQRYPGVKRYMDDTKAAAKSMGYVETVFGRRLSCPKSTPQRPPPRRGRTRRSSTRPCRARRPTSIKLAMVAVQRNWTPQAGHPDDHAGARRTGVRTARERGGLAQTHIPR